MTCFDRDELWEHVGGLVTVIVPLVIAAAVALGWALAVLAAQLMRRPCPCPCCRRRPGRRRRPPLAVLAHPDHNPDIDGVHAPPDPDKETP
jgi:hypothetical protein